MLLCGIKGKAPPHTMQGLLGEYEITIDAKGRLKLPVGYLKQLNAGEDAEFVLSRGFEKSLSFYTLEQWKIVETKMADINEYTPEGRKLKRIMMSGATKLSPDSAGRVLLPKPMIEHAGMKKDIVFSAQMNKVEIWDLATYKEVTSFDADEMSELAGKVLGNGFTSSPSGGSEI